MSNSRAKGLKYYWWRNNWLMWPESLNGENNTNICRKPLPITVVKIVTPCCFLRSWLRHFATSRELASSIPDGVIRIFASRNLSSGTMVLRSTHPLTQISITYFLEGWGGQSIGLTTLPHKCADCLEIWETQNPGNLRASPGLYRDCFNPYPTAFPYGNGMVLHFYQ